VNKSWTASCVVVRSPPWTQQSRCIPIESMAWLHMHKKWPWVVGWGRPNVVHNVEKNVRGHFERWDEWVGKCQALKLRPIQDLSWMQWQFKNNSEIMLENECSCTFFKMFTWTRSVFLSNSCSNSEMKTWTTKGRRSWTHLRWTWNGSGPKLLALIAPNKNEWSYCKNLDVMIGATSP